MPRLTWAPSREILRIGALSALAAATTNVTIIAVTGFVGSAGSGAVAGYGTGARLEYLLVPPVFGLALCFAGQGAGRVGWPLVASILRMAVSLGGAWLALAFGLGLPGLFAALARGAGRRQRRGLREGRHDSPPDGLGGIDIAAALLRIR